MFPLDLILNEISQIIGSVYYPILIGLPVLILDTMWDVLQQFMSYFTFTNLVFYGGDISKATANKGGTNILNAAAPINLDNPIIIIWMSMVGGAIFFGMLTVVFTYFQNSLLNKSAETASDPKSGFQIAKRVILAFVLMLIFPWLLQITLALIDWIFTLIISPNPGLTQESIDLVHSFNGVLNNLSDIKQKDIVDQLNAIRPQLSLVKTDITEVNSLGSILADLLSKINGTTEDTSSNGVGLLTLFKSWDANLQALKVSFSTFADKATGAIDVGLSNTIREQLSWFTLVHTKLSEFIDTGRTLSTYDLVGELIGNLNIVNNLNTLSKSIGSDSPYRTLIQLIDYSTFYNNFIDSLDPDQSVVFGTTGNLYKILDIKQFLSGSGNGLRDILKVGAASDVTNTGGQYTLIEQIRAGVFDKTTGLGDVEFSDANTAIIKQMLINAVRSQSSGAGETFNSIVKFATDPKLSNTISSDTYKDSKRVLDVFTQLSTFWATSLFRNNINTQTLEPLFGDFNTFTDGGLNKIIAGDIGNLALQLSYIVKGKPLVGNLELTDDTIKNITIITNNNETALPLALTASGDKPLNQNLFQATGSLAAKPSITPALVVHQIAVNDPDSYDYTFMFHSAQMENVLIGLLLALAFMWTIFIFFLYLIVRVINMVFLFIMSPWALFAKMDEPILKGDSKGYDYNTSGWRGFIWWKAMMTEATSILIAGLSFKIFAELVQPLKSLGSSIFQQFSSITLISNLFGGLIILVSFLATKDFQKLASQYIAGWIFSEDSWYSKGEGVWSKATSFAKQGIAMASGAGALMASGAGAARQAGTAAVGSGREMMSKKRTAKLNSGKALTANKRAKMMKKNNRWANSRQGQHRAFIAKNRDEYQTAKAAGDSSTMKQVEDRMKQNGMSRAALNESKLAGGMSRFYSSGNLARKQYNRGSRAANGADKWLQMDKLQQHLGIPTFSKSREKTGKWVDDRYERSGRNAVLESERRKNITSLGVDASDAYMEEQTELKQAITDRRSQRSQSSRWAKTTPLINKHTKHYDSIDGVDNMLDDMSGKSKWSHQNKSHQRSTLDEYGRMYMEKYQSADTNTLQDSERGKPLIEFGTTGSVAALKELIKIDNKDIIKAFEGDKGVAKDVIKDITQAHAIRNNIISSDPDNVDVNMAQFTTKLANDFSKKLENLQSKYQKATTADKKVITKQFVRATNQGMVTMGVVGAGTVSRGESKARDSLITTKEASTILNKQGLQSVKGDFKKLFLPEVKTLSQVVDQSSKSPLNLQKAAKETQTLISDKKDIISDAIGEDNFNSLTEKEKSNILRNVQKKHTGEDMMNSNNLQLEETIVEEHQKLEKQRKLKKQMAKTSDRLKQEQQQLRANTRGYDRSDDDNNNSNSNSNNNSNNSSTDDDYGNKHHKK